MKDWIKRKYDWWRHFLWLIGRMITYFILFDDHNAKDCYWWIRVHLTYKSRRIK